MNDHGALRHGLSVRGPYPPRRAISLSQSSAITGAATITSSTEFVSTAASLTTVICSNNDRTVRCCLSVSQTADGTIAFAHDSVRNAGCGDPIESGRLLRCGHRASGLGGHLDGVRPARLAVEGR